MKKRTWHYLLKPAAFEMACDKCNSTNLDWSEWSGKIWCYDCKIDTDGFAGVFGGPIPVNACEMMGITFHHLGGVTLSHSLPSITIPSAVQSSTPVRADFFSFQTI